MTKVIDLSKAIKFNKQDPYFMQVKIKHKLQWIAHWMIRFLGLPFKLMPKDFVGWDDDTITKMGCTAPHILMHPGIMDLEVAIRMQQRLIRSLWTFA